MLRTTVYALLLALPAVPQSGRAETPAAGPDRALRGVLKVCEGVFDERVRRMTDRAPFALLGSTRGAYLAGYGAVFSLEVNLVPVANISPFRPAYTRAEIQALNKQKREKLGVLKTGLRPLLVEQAAALGQVPASEKIAVVVNLFNLHWEDVSGLPSQVVMQASRQSLLDLQARRAGPEELERAIEVREF